MKHILIIIIALLFFKCSKDETFPVRPEPTNSAILNPEVGGPNEQNQVFVDLSTEQSTIIQRDSWDLGFYSGNSFRIIINPSIYMAVKNLGVTNLNLIS
ncbi:HmuY family protein, partial [Lutibacter sp.]|uniref:HmuY family protein n=1 Tax=Lutibacter sp. TaxID=1925666 RepID=UPI0025BF4EDA